MDRTNPSVSDKSQGSGDGKKKRAAYLQKTFREKICTACAKRVFTWFGDLEATGLCTKQSIVKVYLTFLTRMQDARPP